MAELIVDVDSNGNGADPFYVSGHTPYKRMPSTSVQELLVAALAQAFPTVPWDDSIEDTARRLAGYWDEFNPAKHEGDLDFEFRTFPAEGKQMVMVSDIQLTSMCAHHLLPIVGRVHVGYIPMALQVGLSKIPRLVDFWAKRPQVQERLMVQISNDLKRRLQPMGVMVVIEAKHMCMCARGVRKDDGVMITSLPSGVYLSNPAARDEFFNLLRDRHR